MVEYWKNRRSMYRRLPHRLNLSSKLLASLKHWYSVPIPLLMLLSAPLFADPPKSWPIFRGNPGLSGYVEMNVTTTPKRLWTFRTEKAVKSAVVATGTTAFASSTDGHVYAIDLKTGKQVWKFNTKASLEAAALLVDDQLFIGNEDGVFYCLSVADGTRLWRYRTENKIIGAANTFSVDGKSIVVFGCHDNRIYALDVQAKSELWTFEAENYINSSPAVIGEQSIAVGCCDGNLYLLRQGTGKLAGKVNTGSYIAGSPAIESAFAWVGNYGNLFMGIDLSKQSIAWSFGDTENGSPFFSSPAVEKDRVIVGGRDGNVYCFLKASGKKLWSFKTRDEVNSSPLILGDHVFVGSDDGRLYMLKLINGTKVWEFEIGAPVTAPPSIIGNTLIIGADDGRIYAFDCTP